MNLELIGIFAFGLLTGLYLGNKTFKEKVNNLLNSFFKLNLSATKKYTCVCGQILKQDQQFCPKCGAKKEK
jgi:rubrerythrin